jgi:hypothetical protein
MTRGCAKCGSMEMTRRCAKCGHSSTILSASVYEKLPCSKSINPAHVVRAYWLSPLNIQNVLTQDATKSLGPSSALCHAVGPYSLSSLKTASVNCAMHHAHDMQKTKEHSVSCRSEWNRRHYFLFLHEQIKGIIIIIRSPRVAMKMLESLIGGLSLYARTITFQKGEGNTKYDIKEAGRHVA